jgi:hypothetical protein
MQETGTCQRPTPCTLNNNSHPSTPANHVVNMKGGRRGRWEQVGQRQGGYGYRVDQDEIPQPPFVLSQPLSFATQFPSPFPWPDPAPYKWGNGKVGRWQGGGEKAKEMDRGGSRTRGIKGLKPETPYPQTTQHPRPNPLPLPTSITKTEMKERKRRSGQWLGELVMAGQTH